MKAIKYFGMLLAAFTLSFTATSCGEIEEDDASEMEIGKPGVKFTKKTATELEVYTSNGYQATVWYAKFNNNKELQQVLYSITYMTKEAAETAARNMKAQGQTVTLNGKTITIDVTEEFEGETYDDILAYFTYLVTGIEE